MTQHFVFLPGTLCDERLFKFQVPEFQGNLVMDLRHSDSVDDMVDIVASAPWQKFILIGFSMGGHVAQEFALKFPERVEKLIVIASTSEGFPPDEKALVLSSLKTIEYGPFRGITGRRLKDYLHPKSFENLEIRNLIQDMNGPDAREVYLRQLKATLDRHEIKEQMRSLQVPTLFVAGGDDKIVLPSVVERSANNVPGAKFISIAECGHFVPLEQPEKLNEVIRTFVGE